MVKSVTPSTINTTTQQSVTYTVLACADVNVTDAVTYEI